MRLKDIKNGNPVFTGGSILVSIVTSMGTVLLPRASYNIEHGLLDDFWRISKKAINFVFLVASPMMLYFIIYAKEGIYFLSGTAYTGSIIPMQIIMPTLLFIGLTNILGIQILVPLGKEKVVLYSEIAGAVVDVIINIILIPQYTSAGAAVGTLVAEFVGLAVQYTVLKNDIANIFKSIHYVKLFLALGLAIAASLWVKTLSFGSFITLLISAILFFGVYGLFLLLMKEELVVDVFNQVIGKMVRKVKRDV